MAAPTVGLADTSLRSLAHLCTPGQASIGHLLPALWALDAAGLRSIDAWGGMTFEHALRALDESPWDRLRALSTHITATPLHLTLRGRCLLGFRPYSSGVVQEFIKQAVDCGIRSFLVYEPLNDLSALKEVTAIVRRSGAGLTLAAVHDQSAPGDGPAITLDVARRLADLRPDALCLKTAGALGARATEELVTSLREAVDVPLEIDLDGRSGLGPLAALAAVKAGAGVVHASAAPPGLDPSGLPVAHLVPAFLDAGVHMETGVEEVAAAVDTLARVLAPGCSALWPTEPEAARAAADFRSLADIPGELFVQVARRLGEHGALTRLPEVVREMIRVRDEIGHPALVAPTGQLVATQAVLNVVYGGRWQVVPDEMKAFLRGEYGLPPQAPAEEVVRAVLNEAAGNDNGLNGAAPLDSFRDQLGPLAESSADALLQALAPEAARPYLERRRAARQIDLSRPLAPEEVDVAGWEDEWHDLGPERVRELVALLEASSVDEVTIENKEGTRVSVRKSPASGAPEAAPAPEAPAAPGTAVAAAQPGLLTTGEGASGLLAADPRSVIRASMVGTFYRSSAPASPAFVEEGSYVDEGDVLCVLEAMKLMNEMVAELAGTITAILVEDGTPVEYGQPLFLIECDS